MPAQRSGSVGFSHATNVRRPAATTADLQGMFSSFCACPTVGQARLGRHTTSYVVIPAILFGMPTALSPSALADQLLTLGVQPGGVLVVHSSYRAIRPVDGGPQGVVDALIQAAGPHGTIVMPSWSGDDDNPFDPNAPSAADLGVIADTFWRQPGAVRTEHP